MLGGKKWLGCVAWPGFSVLKNPFEAALDVTPLRIL